MVCVCVCVCVCVWQLAHGHNYDAFKCPCASCMLLLHPAPTCTNGCWCPVPLTLSNLHRWCFSFQQLAQTLYLHLWWLPSATCTGGLFSSTTCAYSNLHCVYLFIYCMPDEARDGRNVALQFLSDCWRARSSKEEFYIRTSACLISFMTTSHTSYSIQQYVTVPSHSIPIPFLFRELFNHSL